MMHLVENNCIIESKYGAVKDKRQNNVLRLT